MYGVVNTVVHTPGGSEVDVFFITDTVTKTPNVAARPSPQYKAVIVGGAEENEVPPEYIKQLKSIADNGYEGDFNFKDIKTNF